MKKKYIDIHILAINPRHECNQIISYNMEVKYVSLKDLQKKRINNYNPLLLKLWQATQFSNVLYRPCHLNFKECSKRCLFLNTRKPHQLYEVLKFNRNRQTTVYCINIFDCYEARSVEYSDFGQIYVCSSSKYNLPLNMPNLKKKEKSVDETTGVG